MAADSVTVGVPTVLGPPGPEPSERIRLVVHGGGPEPWTRVVELPDGTEASIGRSRAATIAIESELVSRMHARFVRKGASVTVEDSGSRNGTWVNGNRIEGPTELRSGDEVDIGVAAILVSICSRVRRPAPLGSTTDLDERLEVEVERGLAYRRSFALAMVRLEGPVAAVESAFRSLAGRLRRMDAMAEYGPDELAILLPELDRVAAEAWADELASAMRDAAGRGGEQARVHVGVAVFPAHGTRPGELVSLSRAALRAARAADDPVHVAPGSEAVLDPDEVVVADPQMKKLRALVRKVAGTPMPILIQGETGVGKELVAAEIHRASARSAGPYLRLNCACLPETLVESELFGHEKGAFTGAEQRRVGYFEAADGGTLFLDEIGEIALALQAKLLRALEQKSFARVGATREVTVDVRMICATNRDLEEQVRAGAFRADLYYRVGAFTLLVPPLRDRPLEIPLLARHFAAQAARELRVPAPGVSPAALAFLERYDWPGNVRELRNAMERAVVIQEGGVIEPDHLPDRVRGRPAPASTAPGGSSARSDAGVNERIAELERDALVAALDECGGNQTRAAQKLGISRRAFVYRMEKYGMKPRP